MTIDRSIASATDPAVMDTQSVQRPPEPVEVDVMRSRNVIVLLSVDLREAATVIRPTSLFAYI
ncbi:hypothetical protein FV219_02605 [Methylobacterium sp. WL122]|nr:hypothetical protein FV219_02605 [Methylobacterium sp. WL122]